MKVIGIVRLAPGQVGYFDDLTRIHLTIQSPEKPVLDGMNTSKLKLSVRSGRILLVTGTLDSPSKSIVKQTPTVEQKKPEPVPQSVHNTFQPGNVLSSAQPQNVESVKQESGDMNQPLPENENKVAEPQNENIEQDNHQEEAQQEQKSPEVPQEPPVVETVSQEEPVKEPAEQREEIQDEDEKDDAVQEDEDNSESTSAQSTEPRRRGRRPNN